jgi:hypothetical protein
MHLLSSYRLAATLTALLCLGACGDSGDTSSGATEAASTTGASTSSTTDVPTSTGESASSSSGASEGQTTSGDSTSAGTDAITTSGPDTDPGTTDPGTTGNIDPCMPDPQDAECASCNKANCCDQAMACGADPECACVLDCVDMGFGPATCLAQCMVKPVTNAIIFAAYTCMMIGCGGECGL